MVAAPGSMVTAPEMKALERYTESASPVFGPGVPLSEATVAMVQTRAITFPAASNCRIFTPIVPSHGAAHWVGSVRTLMPYPYVCEATNLDAGRSWYNATLKSLGSLVLQLFPQ